MKTDIYLMFFNYRAFNYTAVVIFGSAVRIFEVSHQSVSYHSIWSKTTPAVHNFWVLI